MLLLSTAAHASETSVHADAQRSGDGTSFVVGVRVPASSRAWGRGCTAGATVWMQEIYKSGITRFKVRWELRGYYDTGIMPTYNRVGWWHSGAFPNDYLSYWVDMTLPYGYLNFAPDRQFSLWAKAVGERPSWWRPDLARRVKAGTAMCETGLVTGRGAR